MFGMGFTEILVIAIIAILFLGPDKLPQTLVDIARFFRSAKRTIASAKASIEEELHIEDVRKEAATYKEELLNGSRELERLSSLDEITGEVSSAAKMADAPAAKSEAPAAPAKPEVVTFAKKTKNAEPSGESTASKES